MAFNEDSSASGHDEPWIQWFCGLKGHEMFCEVERSYIEDGFNLYGLRACVSNFSDCLDLILDRIGPDDSDDSHLTQSACTLYGLIHARYIITAHGLDAMYNKYAAKDFGTCPLVQCQLQNVLPVGTKDEMGADTVKLFCPKCQEVYHAPPVRSRANNNGGVDGAAFGTTFPHLFLMTFSNLVPDPLPVETSYIPRVFGFRVHKSARQQQHRTTPATITPATAERAQPNTATAAAANDAPDPPAVVSKSGTNNTNDNGTTQINIDNSTGGNNNNPQQQQQQGSNIKAEEEPPTRLAANNNDNTNNSNNTVVSLLTAASAAAAAEADAKQQMMRSSSGKSSGKRPARKDEPQQLNQPQAPDGTGGTNGNKPGSGGSAPTFLMENPAKRRRRNNNNNATT